ncbi:MAG TPA: ATPase domain-containing protein [Thermoplasmata archaeon]|nr:ATPase domain-containing protein [Thermoplasmata archaeon]
MKDGAPPIFGIPEIDHSVQAVLPPGWLGLIEGGPGAGTHLLAKQAAHVAAGAMPVLYYATHESATEVARVFDEFGWDAAEIKIADLDSEFFAAGRQRDNAVYRTRARGLSLAEAMSTQAMAPLAPPPAPVGRLIADIATLDSPFRYIVDSYDLLLEMLTGPEATTVARQLRHRAYETGAGALLVFRREVAEPRTLALLEVIADFIVRMELVRDGDVFFPSLAIEKVRNHPELTRVLRGTVTPKGIEAHR